MTRQNGIAHGFVHSAGGNILDYTACDSVRLRKAEQTELQ
jgi:hypothetical protein